MLWYPVICSRGDFALGEVTPFFVSMEAEAQWWKFGGPGELRRLHKVWQKRVTVKGQLVTNLIPPLGNACEYPKKQSKTYYPQIMQ